MDMERIDKNTIRVFLGKDDLAERGITDLDLLGSKKQIDRFFYRILEEVGADKIFNENDAVTFQVMPQKNGLELLISKLSEEDLRHTNLSSGSTKKPVDDTQPKPQNKHQLADLQAKLQGSDQKQPEDEDDFNQYLEQGEVDYERLVLRLPNFDALIQLASVLRLDSGISNLYRYQEAYYLELVFFPDEMHELSAADAKALASEYGEKSRLTADFLDEYGQKLMDQVALATTRHYFLNND